MNMGVFSVPVIFFFSVMFNYKFLKFLLLRLKSSLIKYLRNNARTSVFDENYFVIYCQGFHVLKKKVVYISYFSI